MPQEQAVFSGLTVKENLLIGQMADATGESRIDEVVGLFPLLGQRFRRRRARSRAASVRCWPSAARCWAGRTC